MYIPSFNISQQYAIVAVASFVIAFWQNRLILWCVFPFLTFAAQKYCLSVYSKKRSVYNSSWLLIVVKIIGLIQRTTSTLLTFNKNTRILRPHNSEEVIRRNERQNSVWKESDKILAFVGRDFIHSWCQFISDNDKPVKDFSGILKHLRSILFRRLTAIDKYTLLRDFVNLYQRHLKVIKYGQAFLRKQPNIRHKSQREKEFKKLKSVVDVVRQQSKMHVALKSVNLETWYLQSVFDSCFLDLLELTLYDSELPRRTLRDITVKSVLAPFMNFLSQPYWLHFIIIKLTSDEDIELCSGNETEQEQKQECNGKPFLHKKSRHDSDCHCCGNSKSVKPTSVVNNNETKPEDVAVDSSCYTKPETHIREDISRPLFHLSDSSEGIFEESGTETLEVAEDVSLNVSSSLEKPSSIFVELSFGNTEKVQEQRSGSVYTIYSIQYLAWHQNDDGSWMVREGFAKRRFREFLTLHERLEEHPNLRLLLKGIKGPTKWMGFPFSNLDEDTIKKRQTHLEKYIKELISESEINNSLAMREFMAYEGDPFIAYVRRPSELYKINQAMIKTVKRVKSNVFDKLKPGSGEILPSSASYQSLPTTGSLWSDGQDPDALSITSVIQEEGHTFQAALEWALTDFEDQMQDLYGEGDTIDEDFFDVLGSSFVGSLSRTSEGCEVDREVPLASSLLDLALQTVSDRECWVRDEVAVKLAKLAIGKFLELFVQSELDSAFTPERCTKYLELISDTLWPDGVLDTSVYVPSPEQCRVTREQAKRCLHNFFPVFLPPVIGKETFDYAVDQVMSSLDDPTLNKDFGYQFLDLLLVHLCPGVSTESRQAHLLNTVDSHMVQS